MEKLTKMNEDMRKLLHSKCDFVNGELTIPTDRYCVELLEKVYQFKSKYFH
jgi:hypothetical protein